MSYLEKYLKYKNKYLNLKATVYLSKNRTFENNLSEIEYKNLNQYLFRLYKKNNYLTEEQQRFITFILKKKYQQIENTLYKVENKNFNKSVKITNIMDKKYNDLKKSNRFPYLKEYSEYAEMRIREKIIENLSEKDISLSFFSNYETIYEINDTYKLNDNYETYCKDLKNSIDNLYKSIIDNNLFIAKYKITNNKNNHFVEFNLEKLMNEDLYEYLGFKYYNFIALNKEENKEYIIKYYYFIFKNNITDEIIICSNNGKLVCFGELYEANRIDTVLLNHLYYFNGTERKLMIYKDINDYIYFSRYTMYELQQKITDSNFLNSLEEIEIVKNKDDVKIKEFIPIIKGENSYMKRINNELKKIKNNFDIRNSEYMIREGYKSGLFLDELIPDLDKQIQNLISYKTGYNYTIYLNKSKINDTQIFNIINTKIIRLLDLYKKISSKDEYAKNVIKQLEELNEDDINKNLKIMEEYIYNLSDEDKEKFSCYYKIFDSELNDIKNKYKISKLKEIGEENKPIFTSWKDLIKYTKITNINNIPKYLPEIQKIINDNNLLSKIHDKTINEPTTIEEKNIIYDILSKRQLLLGDSRQLTDYYTNKLLFIADSFFFNFEADYNIYPPNWCWSPTVNKIYVNILGDRDIIFPVKYVLPIDNSLFVVYNDYNSNNKNKFLLIGLIHLKLKKEKDIFYYIFYNDIEDKIYKITGNQVYLNQSLGTARRWHFIEINQLLYYFKIIKQQKLYVYNINNTDEYLFSKYSLVEIRQKYFDMNLNTEELDNLIEKEIFKDEFTKKISFRDIN